MTLACHRPDDLFPDTASGNHMFLVDQAAETPERSCDGGQRSGGGCVAAKGGFS